MSSYEQLNEQTANSGYSLSYSFTHSLSALPTRSTSANEL